MKEETKLLLNKTYKNDILLLENLLDEDLSAWYNTAKGNK